MNANKSGIVIGSAARTTVDTTSAVAKATASAAKSFLSGIAAGYKGLNTVKPSESTQITVKQ